LTSGRVLSRTDTAGLTLANSYDAAGRLSTAVTKTPGNVVVSSYGYSYDSASNVTGYSQTLPVVSGQANPDSGSWAYTYNQREELATAKLGSNPTLTYAYNDSGDRASVQVGAGHPHHDRL
jgi:YD repeat-containing protein